MFGLPGKVVACCEVETSFSPSSVFSLFRPEAVDALISFHAPAFRFMLLQLRLKALSPL